MSSDLIAQGGGAEEGRSEVRFMMLEVAGLVISPWTVHSFVENIRKK